MNNNITLLTDTMKRKMTNFTALMLTIFIFSVSGLAIVHAQPTFNYTYDCQEGSIYAVIIIDNVEGFYNVTINKDTGVIDESIVALDEKGNPLPVLTTDSQVTIITGNITRSIRVSYIIIPNEINDLYMIEVISLGTATIILPPNGTLAYASDSPQVYTNSSRITLVYNTPGLITVYYSVVNSGQTQNGSIQTTTWMTTSSTPPGGGYNTETSASEGSPLGGNRHMLVLALIVAFIILLYAYWKKGIKKERPKNEESGIEISITDLRLDERDKLILNLISAKEHTISSLSRESGLSKSVVWRRVKKLEEMGLIEGSKGIGSVKLKLTEKGRKILERMSEKDSSI